MRETNTQILIASKVGDLSARDFLMPLFRRKRLLIGTFVGVLAAVILLAALLGLPYSSRMEILVNRERLDPLVSTEATTQILSADNPRGNQLRGRAARQSRRARAGCDSE
jgi:uncharacterized protein involved in exopolysaccharide biosynthesis